MTQRESSYSPVHDEDSDGEIINSYGMLHKDSLRDEVCQSLKDGTLEQFIDDMAKGRSEEIATRLLSNIICLILESDKPRLEIQCLCLAIGLSSLIGGKSGQELGKEYGQTRQNIAEKVKKIRLKLNLTNKLRTGKSDKAKKNYKKYNRARERDIIT